MTVGNEHNKTSVLIIEDDRDDFYLTNDTLLSIEGQPYRASWSGSFEAAQKLLTEQTFDVALVDYQIGRKTGLDFISEVGPHYPNCPMILLTGLRSPEIDRAAQAAGAADYLPKELLSAEFLDRTIRYTRQHAERWSLLNSILTTASSGMIAVDLSLKPIVWNVQGLQALDIVKPIGSVTWEEVAIALSRLPGEDRLPTEFVNSQGKTFELQVTDVPSVGQVIAFHDVSKRAEAEALLLKAVKEAEDANLEKSKFLATMSHELRTPLNGILGMVGVMQRGFLDSEQQSSVDTIKSCGEGLLRMINDLLDLSKIEAGAMQIERKEFDLGNLVESTTRLLAPTAFSKGLEITTYFDPALPEKMEGDALRTKQVLINLIGNAIKFTSSGAVRISVTARRAPDGDMIHFEVADSGPGIAPEQQQELFQRFKQLDSCPSNNAGGTGLGLALCKEMITLMNGGIGVSSSIGHGSRFWFTIPDYSLEQDRETIARRVRVQLRDVSLLAVTREDAVRDTISAYVEALGGEVQFATDEQSAIAMLQQQSYHHVIFDNHGFDHPPTGLIEHFRTKNTGTQGRIWCLQDRDQSPRSSGCPFDDILPRPLTAFSVKKVVAGAYPGNSSNEPNENGSGSISGQPARRNFRLLVAEDNVASQLVAKSVLTSAGYAVDIASDGHQAVQRAQECEYDAVLMDVCMPGLDGFEAAQRIRLTEKNADVVIIGATADVTVEAESNFRAVGIDRCFVKPIDWDELMSLLGKLEGAVVHTASKPASELV